MKWFYRHIYWRFRAFRRFVISKYQTFTKGYADEEVWNLSDSLSRWILPRLRHLRNNFSGMPINREIEQKAGEFPLFLTKEEWEDRLDKMIFVFEYVLNIDKYEEMCYPHDYKWGLKLDVNGDITRNFELLDKRRPDWDKLKPFEKQYNDGIALFSLYLWSLCD